MDRAGRTHARTHAQFGFLYAYVSLAAFLFAVAAIAYGMSGEQSPSSCTSRGRRRSHAPAKWQLLREGLEYLVYAPIAFGAGSVLALVSVILLSPPADAHVQQFATYLASVGAPWLLVILGLTMILHIGLVGRSFADSSREWWSRQGGWIGIVALVWAALFLLTVRLACTPMACRRPP